MLKRASQVFVGLLLVLFTSANLAVAESTPTPQTNKIKVNGIELGYRVTGSGAPLLLITGYGATMDSWDHVLIDQLSDNFKVIVFDNRGMGYSSINKETLTIKLMADDAAGLLKALGVVKADVLGWSMGSMIAQEVALNYPGKVGKLILYATACTNKEANNALAHVATTQSKPLAERYFPTEWYKQNPDALERMPKSSVPPSPATVALQSKACSQWQGTEDRLSKLNIPVLLLVGADDDITPPSQSVRMARLIPGAWLAQFKGGSHFLQYQAPQDMARVVSAFLQAEQNLIK